MPRPTIAVALRSGCRDTLAQQDQEVTAQEVRLVLHRGAAAGRHEHVEEFLVPRFLVARRVLAERVEDLVDDARDLALRDDEVAATERAAPVGGVRTEHVQDALRDAAIVSHHPTSSDNSRALRYAQVGSCMR